LDEEAHKISSLILAVNKMCAGRQVDEVARELFQWAEEMSRLNRGSEAEFLYLHAINIWERHHTLSYPITFTSLRDYAAKLLDASNLQRSQNNLAVVADELQAAPIAADALQNAA
jgi:hypothetical protein